MALQGWHMWLAAAIIAALVYWAYRRGSLPGGGGA